MYQKSSLVDEEQGLAPLALSIIVPVRNESVNIAGVLCRILRNVHSRPYEVLIVYDFEDDDTLPVVYGMMAQMPELRLIFNSKGPGVINAVRCGFAEASAPFVVVTMGDGSDDLCDIDRMVGLAKDGAHVVAASRYMRGGRQVGGPIVKGILSRLAGLSLFWLGGVPTHDATSNFKLYSKEFLDLVTIESDGGFEVALELTVKAYLLGLRIVEVPTKWKDRTAGRSRFKLMRWLPRYLKWYMVGLTSRWRARRVGEVAVG